MLADTRGATPRSATAFGKPIADFQNTQFQLAEMATELDVARAYVDARHRRARRGRAHRGRTRAKAKLWATEIQNRVIDRCLQLHGGYGYMLEYPWRAPSWTPASAIFGGTNEIMKDIIGRDLVGRP